MTSQRPIGLYDSGIGGLSVVREVFRQLPGERVLYLGDTARVPYGPRPRAEIIAFNLEIAGFMVQAGAKLIVIACNTSSAQALDEVRAQCPVPVVGLIGPGAAAAAAGAAYAKAGIGVIATEGTIRSGAYGDAIRRLAPGVPVREVACPELVPLIEQGIWTGPIAEAAVRRALAVFLAAPPACLVLGCTHYPLLAPLIQAQLGPETQLINPAEGAIATAATLLGASSPTRVERSAHRFLVSGDPEPFYQSATRLFPGCIAQVEQVVLPSLSAAAELTAATGP